jgi:hypothetical protein
MSGTPGPSNTGKAIASLAKMPADTTRAGTQKMKFVPTLPIRRKKEYVRPRGIRGHCFAHDEPSREAKQVSASAFGGNLMSIVR